ncbi:MAG TPA: 50S ribosomal protein L21 [Patescibacteria group bacterium]|jgi:large subunit ribosomal protein L21|nr:50S ribosomal protein L21 [Patescibacteria group bacterium]
MKQAVIETGGKQYLVSPKDKLTVEKLDVKDGHNVVFDKVLLVSENDKVSLGKPYVSGARVTAKVLSQEKSDKIIVFKYRAKSRYRRKQGHRQQQTVVEIESIS